MSKKRPNPQKRHKEHNFVMLTQDVDKKRMINDCRGNLKFEYTGNATAYAIYLMYLYNLVFIIIVDIV